jgi:Peptidase A4 family
MLPVARLAAAAVATVLVVGSPAASGSSAWSTEISANWAGYVVSGLDPRAAFTHVTGTWKVPAVKCRAGSGVSVSAVWVGLGGHEPYSVSLEQIGTDSDCSAAGRASYYAWYELIPAPSVRLRLAVRPGDTITASVGPNAAGTKVRLELKNRTRGRGVTKLAVMSTIDLSSAEWIVEAPSLCGRFTCHPMPLANFGSVTFTQATASLDGRAGTIQGSEWTAIRTLLVPGGDDDVFLGGPRPETGTSSSTAGAVPGLPSANGRSFRIVWQANSGL